MADMTFRQSMKGVSIEEALFTPMLGTVAIWVAGRGTRFNLPIEDSQWLYGQLTGEVPIVVVGTFGQPDLAEGEGVLEGKAVGTLLHGQGDWMEYGKNRFIWAVPDDGAEVVEESVVEPAWDADSMPGLGDPDEAGFDED